MLSMLDHRRLNGIRNLTFFQLMKLYVNLCSGFSEIAHVLCGEHKIDGKVLLSMTEEDLLLPLLNLKVFGDVRRLSLLLDNVR